MQKLLLALILAMAATFLSAAEGENLNILLISSLAGDDPSTASFLDAFCGGMKDSGYKTEIFLEYLDTARLGDSAQKTRAILDLLGERYRDVRLDIILAQSSQAADAAITLRNGRFPGTPVLCFGQMDSDAISRFSSEPNVYGRILNLPFLPTLKLASSLFPRAKKAVLLVTAASPGVIAAYQDMMDAFRDERPDLTLVPVFNGDYAAADKALSSAGADSFAVFLPGGWKLPDGSFLLGTDMVDHFRAKYRIPFFSHQESSFGTGLLGGSFVDFGAMGKDAAAMVPEILFADRKPVPWLFVDLSRDTLDYRALVGFPVAASSIPAGTKLVNVPPSFWLKYEGPLKAFFILLLAFLALLFFVLLFRWRETALLRKSVRQSMVEAEGSRLRARLLANLNHEINTPLGNALVASSVIEENYQDGKAASSAFRILSRALGDVQSIANDRSFFWNPGSQVMGIAEFQTLLDRMVRRSMSGSHIELEHSFGSIALIPESHTFLLVMLHAIDFLGHLADNAVIRLDLSSSPLKDGSTEWLLTASDRAPSILSRGVSVFRVGNRRAELVQLRKGHLSKLLYLDYKARYALGGSFRLERTDDGSNRIVVRFAMSQQGGMSKSEAQDERY